MHIFLCLVWAVHMNSDYVLCVKFYTWRWWGLDMAIAHYCPKSVWPLSRPGFTVITRKVQKVAQFRHIWPHGKHIILCTTSLLSPPKCKNTCSMLGNITHDSLHISNSFLMAWLFCNHVQSPNTLQTRTSKWKAHAMHNRVYFKQRFYDMILDMQKNICQTVFLWYDFACAKTATLSNLMTIIHEQSLGGPCDKITQNAHKYQVYCTLLRFSCWR